MLAGRASAAVGNPGPGRAAEISIHRIEAARQSRALVTALGGTCVAVFTFLLFFLYPRYTAGFVDPTLFQLSLLAILVSLFLLVFSSWFFFLFTESLGIDPQRPGKYLARADACFAGAVIVLALAPCLILFTVDLQVLGLVALGMWGVYLVVFAIGVLSLAGWRKGRASTR